MSNINNPVARPAWPAYRLGLAQICWVIPDIHTAVKFLSNTLGIAGFPKPDHVRAQDLDMTYYGKAVAGEWLTTQAYNGGTFIELVQPVSGQSMFHDYLDRFPAGGIQHHAFGLPVTGFERVTSNLREQGLCGHQRSRPPHRVNGFLRYLQNFGCCYGDHGHHTGRMKSDRTNGRSGDKKPE